MIYLTAHLSPHILRRSYTGTLSTYAQCCPPLSSQPSIHILLLSHHHRFRKRLHVCYIPITTSLFSTRFSLLHSLHPMLLYFSLLPIPLHLIFNNNLLIFSNQSLPYCYILFLLDQIIYVSPTNHLNYTLLSPILPPTITRISCLTITFSSMLLLLLYFYPTLTPDSFLFQKQYPP